MGLRVDRQHVLWNQLPCTVILASSRIDHLRCWAAAGQDICAGVGQRGGWGISLELQKFCPLPPPGQSCGGSAAVREQSQVRLPAQQEEGRGGVLFKPYFFVEVNKSGILRDERKTTELEIGEKDFPSLQ